MIAWNTEIVKRLITGSIKNVQLFGDNIGQPEPPYVVVKPIASGDRKLFQIIVHSFIGSQDILEAYVLRELTDLFKEPLGAGDLRISVLSTGGWLGPYIDEGDNTLAMSRDFYIPITL